MAFLTANRSTTQYGGVSAGVIPERFSLPVEANTVIYQGGLVMTDTAGNAAPAGITGGLGAVACVGRAEQYVNNNPGVAGAQIVNVRQGAFLWNVSGTLTQANFGQKVYVKDDNTVQPLSAASWAGPAVHTGTGPAATNITPSGSPINTTTGYPSVPLYVFIYIVLGGAVATATFQYAISNSPFAMGDFGATITTAASVPLTGTGITLAFAAGTYVLGDVYAYQYAPVATTSNLVLCAGTFLGLDPQGSGNAIVLTQTGAFGNLD